MNPRRSARRAIDLIAVPVIAALVAPACERDTSDLAPYPPNTDPVVFADEFSPGLDFQAFLGSKLDALSIDTEIVRRGSASLRIVVPGLDDLSGTYAGGALVTSGARDLSGYDALTFWARASESAALDAAGFGNDNTGTSRYDAGRANVPLTTEWTYHVVPIPDPSKLTDETGLFFFAEGREDDDGYEFWIDEIRFERLASIENPRPLVTARTVSRLVGGTADVEGTQTTFAVDEGNGLVDRVVLHQPGYFSYLSSDESVATVDRFGHITIVGEGGAEITGRLREIDAIGRVTVTGIPTPQEAAPVPTHAAADVIAIYSDAYANVPVDRWSTEWDYADFEDIEIDGNPTKVFLYRGQAWNGTAIEFTAPTVDASEMTYLHLDVWVPGTSTLRVKLVDLGADGAFGGEGDNADSETELQISAATNPPLVPGQWVGYDIPLAVFGGLRSTEHLAQLFLSITSAENILFVDNIYFRR